MAAEEGPEPIKFGAAGGVLFYPRIGLKSATVSRPKSASFGNDPDSRCRKNDDCATYREWLC